MPGTAKILRSNLTRISFFKQVVGQFFVCLSVVGFVTSGIVFLLLRAVFFNYAFSVWFTATICNSNYLVFVLPLFFLFC